MRWCFWDVSSSLGKEQVQLTVAYVLLYSSTVCSRNSYTLVSMNSCVRCSSLNRYHTPVKVEFTPPQSFQAVSAEENPGRRANETRYRHSTIVAECTILLTSVARTAFVRVRECCKLPVGTRTTLLRAYLVPKNWCIRGRRPA